MIKFLAFRRYSFGAQPSLTDGYSWQIDLLIRIALLRLRALARVINNASAQRYPVHLSFREPLILARQRARWSCVRSLEIRLASRSAMRQDLSKGPPSKYIFFQREGGGRGRGEGVRVPKPLRPVSVIRTRNNERLARITKAIILILLASMISWIFITRILGKKKKSMIPPSR